MMTIDLISNLSYEYRRQKMPTEDSYLKFSFKER